MWANVGPNRHANETNWLTKFSRILRTVFLAIEGKSCPSTTSSIQTINGKYVILSYDQILEIPQL
jgi:hypothetical protein